MEETEIGEVSTDKLGEQVHEKAKEEHGREPWLRGLALTTAFFAVLAAIASLESGSLANESILHMNEATLKQTQASDQWTYYQAKGIKQVTREAAADMLTASHAPSDAIGRSTDEAGRYAAQQEEIKKKAEELEKEQQEFEEKSRQDLEHHHRFAYAVTTLQVAIGLSAIAALIEKRWMWFVAMVAGAAGVVLFIQGLLVLR